MLLFQILAFNIHEKNVKNLKYQPHHGNKSLNYLMNHILNETFKNILSISSKNTKQLMINLQ